MEFLESLTWIDYAILTVIGLSMLFGLLRGFTREVLSLSAWIMAIWAGYSGSSMVSNALAHIAPNPTLRSVLAFFVVFFLALLVGLVIANIIAGLVKKTVISGVDRMLGLVFGSLRGVLIIGLLIIFSHLGDLAKQPGWTESRLMPAFQPLASWIDGMLPKTNPIVDQKKKSDV